MGERVTVKFDEEQANTLAEQFDESVASDASIMTVDSLLEDVIYVDSDDDQAHLRAQHGPTTLAHWRDQLDAPRTEPGYLQVELSFGRTDESERRDIMEFVLKHIEDIDHISGATDLFVERTPLDGDLPGVSLPSHPDVEDDELLATGLKAMFDALPEPDHPDQTQRLHTVLDENDDPIEYDDTMNVPVRDRAVASGIEWAIENDRITINDEKTERWVRRTPERVLNECGLTVQTHETPYTPNEDAETTSESGLHP